MNVIVLNRQCVALLTAMILAVPAARGDDQDAAAKPAWSPVPFEATYKVLHGRKQIGTSTNKLTIAGDGLYEYRNDAEPQGFFVKLLVSGEVYGVSRFSVANGLPRPLTYQSDGPKSNDYQSIVFNYDVDQAFSSYEGEQQVLDLLPATVDFMSMDIALMLQMKNGCELADIQVIYRNESQLYLYQLEGDDTTETDAGQFETVRVRRQREGSSRYYLMWLAPSLNYLPVRVDQYKDGEVNNSLILTRYEEQAG